MAMLHYVSLLGLSNDFLFCGLALNLVLLNATKEFSSWERTCAFRLKANSLHEFEIIPVNIALTDLFGHLLLLAPCLLLPCLVVVIHQSASRKDGVSIAYALLEPIHLFLRHFQYSSVGLHEPCKVGMALGGRTQELELRIILFTL